MSSKITIDWNALYKNESNRLLGICRRYVRDIQVAEDLLHDGFVKAMENVSSYSGHGPIEAWLRKVVLNHVLEYLRNAKKVNFTDVEDIHLPEEENISYDDNSFRSLVASQDFSQSDLLEAIDTIPEHHKTVFCLYVIDGYSHKEISERLGIELGTSKSHLSRARKKIQQQLVAKATEMKQKEEHKKRRKLLAAIPLGTAGVKANAMDQMFRLAFSDFSLSVSHQPDAFKKRLQDAQTIQVKVPNNIFSSSVKMYCTIGIVGSMIIGTITYLTSNYYTESKIEPTIKNGFIKADSVSSKHQQCIQAEQVSIQKQSITIKQVPDKHSIKNTSSNNPPTQYQANVNSGNTQAPTPNTALASSTNEKDTVSKVPVVVRKKVIIRKTVTIDEEPK